MQARSTGVVVRLLASVTPVAVIALVLLSSGAACVKRDTAVETQRVTDKLSAYWTCAVTFASDGSGADANEAFTFVPWFEGRMRERGVFEPLGRDESAEAEVTVRLAAEQSGNQIDVRAQILDTHTNTSLGELEAFARIDPNADAGDASESPRFVALRGAASQILEVLREKRRTSMNEARRAPPPPVAPKLPDGPPVAGSAVCTTECHPPASSTSTHDEQYRVAAAIDPTMKQLRDCLDRVGAQLVNPAVLLRFSPDGQLRHIRVDVGGYEQNDCIQQVRSRQPRTVWTSRASLLRCEYRCTVS